MTNDNDSQFPEQIDLPGSEPDKHTAKEWRPTHSKNRVAGKTVKRLLIGGGVLVLLAVGLIGGRSLLTRKNTASSAETAVRPAPPPAPVVQKDVPDAAATKVYENGPLGVSLTYPTTWTATETADGGIRIESPLFSYTKIDKQLVNGSFRIYLRKGARPKDSSYIGRGVAIADSQKLTYTKPAPGQRTDTWLSHFGLDTADNFAYFLIAGNFQLKLGDTLGPGYGKEAETYIVAGGYSSKDNIDDLGMNAVDPATLKTSNAYKQAIVIIQSLQLL